MSNQCPQPKSHQFRTDSYPLFSSMRIMDSKRKWLRVCFAFFQKKLPAGRRVNETVATIGELTDLWKPGTMDEISQSVMKCNFYFLLYSLKNSRRTKIIFFINLKNILLQEPLWIFQKLYLLKVDVCIKVVAINEIILWWTKTVLKCSYLFQLFDFYSLPVHYLLFFWNFIFLFRFFDDFEWEVKVHWQPHFTVTLPLAAEAASFFRTLQKFNLA